MEHVEVIEGVVAELNGKYWGFQHGDRQYTVNDFGDFMHAEISNPKYCKKPTDKTWNPNNSDRYNPDYDKLLKAKLVKVRKTVTTKFEILE